MRLFDTLYEMNSTFFYFGDSRTFCLLRKGKLDDFTFAIFCMGHENGKLYSK